MFGPPMNLRVSHHCFKRHALAFRATETGVRVANGPLWNAFHNGPFATQTPTSAQNSACRDSRISTTWQSKIRNLYHASWTMFFRGANNNTWWLVYLRITDD